MTKKKITIYDVAKHCGVSVATVSRIVNNADYPVSNELRLRVQASVRELNYKPNMLGRYLKSNRADEVGVIIPNISNFYYPDLIAGINDSLIHSGYNVLLCNSYRNPEYEKKQFLSLLQKQVKGIVMSTVSDDTSWIEEVNTDGVTVVAIEQPLYAPTHRVCFNYYGGRLYGRPLSGGNGTSRDCLYQRAADLPEPAAAAGWFSLPGCGRAELN